MGSDEQGTEQVDKLKERIAELEKQLAEKQGAVKRFMESSDHYLKELLQAERREAVLREALGWIEGRVEPYTLDLRSGHYSLATDIKDKARAALEVK